MSKLTKRNHNGKCCCSWDECGEWCRILKDSDKEEGRNLGSISRITLGQHNHSTSYLKCASKHLKFDASEYREKKYLYLAKHHLPHEYIRGKNKSLKIAKPISKEQADLHGITTFDNTNIAVKGSKSQPTLFYLAPVVAKSTVKRLVESIGMGGLRQERVSKRNRDQPATVTVTPTKPAGDKASIPPTVMDPATSITHYCCTIEKIQDVIHQIVKFETIGMESSDGDTLNKKLQEHEHFRNISTILKDFYRYTGHFEIGSNRYIYICIGNEPHCLKTIFYKSKRKEGTFYYLVCKLSETAS